MDGNSFSSLSHQCDAEDNTALRSAVHKALHLIANADHAADHSGACLHEVRSLLADALEKTSHTPSLDICLNERQRETLTLVAEGLTNRLIARRMNVEEEVVKSQVRLLLDRLGLRNRTALALWAVRKGLVTLDDTV